MSGVFPSEAIAGFPPIADCNAMILILGTIPGVESLKRRQYYGHPRNAFWPLMESLFGGARERSYPARKRLLTRNRIALWDVLYACQRQGSLDQNIRRGSEYLNDFDTFFRDHPRISAVFFNGQNASLLFKRLYLRKKRDFPIPQDHIIRLPSTSPANATMSFDEKRTRWSLLLQYVEKM